MGYIIDDETEIPIMNFKCKIDFNGLIKNGIIQVSLFRTRRRIYKLWKEDPFPAFGKEIQ